MWVNHLVNAPEWRGSNSVFPIIADVFPPFILKTNVFLIIIIFLKKLFGFIFSFVPCLRQQLVKQYKWTYA